MKGRREHAAIAWELVHPALTGLMIGVRSEKEACEMIGGTDWKLTSDEMSLMGDALAVWEGRQFPAI